MLIRIAYCEKCDDMKFSKELITWTGTCPNPKCGKGTCKIALFDTDKDIKFLLQEA